MKALVIALLLFAFAPAFGQPQHYGAGLPGSANGLEVGNNGVSMGGATRYTGTIKATPATGAMISFVARQRTALIVPAGTIATLTVTLLACNAISDGEEPDMIFRQIVTALTVNAAAGSVVGAPAAAAIGVGQVDHCYGADTTWYKM